MIQLHTANENQQYSTAIIGRNTKAQIKDQWISSNDQETIGWKERIRKKYRKYEEKSIYCH